MEITKLERDLLKALVDNKNNRFDLQIVGPYHCEECPLGGKYSRKTHGTYYTCPLNEGKDVYVYLNNEPECVQQGWIYSALIDLLAKIQIDIEKSILTKYKELAKGKQCD